MPTLLALTALLASLATAPLAEEVEVGLEVVVPEDTPADAAVFVTGDFQGWNPAEEAFRLRRNDEGRFTIALSLERGRTVRFKLTRGSWESVEKGPRGEEIADRELVADEAKTVRLEVAAWRDPAAVPEHTIVGQVEVFALEEFLGGRRVWIYVPPGYDDEPERRYPVLYMLDGQNVFDAATSFSGEWRMDETLEAEIPAGRVTPMIVVAIDNAGDRRSHEYTPWDRAQGAGDGGGARAFLDALAGTLKPHVDAGWRTLRDREHTAIGGSSLGGLFAAWAICERPEVFGAAAAFSPALSRGGARLIELARKPAGERRRVYLDMGTRESARARDADGNGLDDRVDGVRALEAAFRRAGVAERDLLCVVADGARHHESAWAARLPGALRALFPGPRATREDPLGEGPTGRRGPAGGGASEDGRGGCAARPSRR